MRAEDTGLSNLDMFTYSLCCNLPALNNNLYGPEAQGYQPTIESPCANALPISDLRAEYEGLSMAFGVAGSSPVCRPLRQ